jgi:hypothetical protein
MDKHFNQLMEQEYSLKEYGKLNLFEQNTMPAEERAWWIKRTETEMKARHEAEKRAAGNAPRR